MGLFDKILKGIRPAKKEEQTFSHQDKKTIRSAERLVEQINESVNIVNSSQNDEEKLIHLYAAKTRVEGLKVLAAAYPFLKLPNLDQVERDLESVEAELADPNRRDPCESTKGVASGDARALLKEATRLKKEKKYEEACEKLRQAYAAPGAENLMIEERLRLPMYLQIAGMSDEGWRILNQLNVEHADEYSQPIIANQFRVFLEKEKLYQQALLFGAWAICKATECAWMNIAGCMRQADWEAEQIKENKVFAFLEEGRDIYGTTPTGNPIKDKAYLHFEQRVKDLLSVDNVEKQLSPLIKKAKLESSKKEIIATVSGYLNSRRHYALDELRDCLGEVVGEGS